MNDLKNAEEEVKTAAEEVRNYAKEPKDDPKDNVDKQRAELVSLSEDGGIDQSVKYLKKASAKVLNKIYAEYKGKGLERANQFLKDLAISKFANLLGGLDAIDVESIVRQVTSYLLYHAYIGILSGGITTSKHVFSHLSKTVNDAGAKGLFKPEDAGSSKQ